MINIINGNRFRSFAMKISGQDFRINLDFIKNLNNSDYDKVEKLWYVPYIDFKSTLKKLKENKIKTLINKNVISSYLEYIRWCNYQLDIKNNKIDIYKEMDGLINGELYPFQKIGSYFLYESGDGLLADSVGLGKTVQTLATLEKHFINKNINLSLIVCPSSIKDNWKEKIQEFLPNRNAIVIQGDKNKRKNIYKKLYNYDFIIINYELLLQDQDFFNSYIYNRNFIFALVIDEIQYIKNLAPKRSKVTKDISRLAKYTIGLSATPLENNVLELWSIFHAIEPELFTSNYRKFLNSYCKVDWFGSVIGVNEENKDDLKKRISPFIIRRFKEDVIDDLPERIENNLRINLSKSHLSIYNDLENKTISGVVDSLRENKFNTADALTQIAYLRQCALSTELIDHENHYSAKTDELINFIDSLDSHNSRVVIFTYFVKMTEILNREFNKNGIKNITMNGNSNSDFFVPMNKRQKLINKFNKDTSIKAFITNDILREGVDLVGASYLVNFDLLLNPARMEQRIGRIDRMNQKSKKINIINMIARDTIEERIFDEILSNKIQLSKDIIDNNRVEKRITVNVIKDLLNIK